jgi:hypothetical protein
MPAKPVQLSDVTDALRFTPDQEAWWLCPVCGSTFLHVIDASVTDNAEGGSVVTVGFYCEDCNGTHASSDHVPHSGPQMELRIETREGCHTYARWSRIAPEQIEHAEAEEAFARRDDRG